MSNHDWVQPCNINERVRGKELSSLGKLVREACKCNIAIKKKGTLVGDELAQLKGFFLVFKILNKKIKSYFY